MSELIADGHERRDLRTIGAAIRKQWLIPESLFTELGERLEKIITYGEPREQIQAARVLIAMHESNERKQPKIVEHAHTHSIIPVTAENLEQSRSEILRRIAEARGTADDTGAT